MKQATEEKPRQPADIFEDLDLDSHKDRLDLIAKARDAVFEELRRDNYPVEKLNLRYTSLPPGYENTLEEALFAFRYNLGKAVVRFNRQSDGSLDFKIKPPSVRPQITIVRHRG